MAHPVVHFEVIGRNPDQLRLCAACLELLAGGSQSTGSVGVPDGGVLSGDKWEAMLTA